LLVERKGGVERKNVGSCGSISLPGEPVLRKGEKKESSLYDRLVGRRRKKVPADATRQEGYSKVSIVHQATGKSARRKRTHRAKFGRGGTFLWGGEGVNKPLHRRLDQSWELNSPRGSVRGTPRQVGGVPPEKEEGSTAIHGKETFGVLTRTSADGVPVNRQPIRGSRRP